MTSLLEYQCHVMDAHADRHGLAWCGVVPHPLEFTFISVDHAALNGRNGGRLVPCQACRHAIVAALSTESVEAFPEPEAA